MKKIRIKQHHISDCGAACLASVAAWYGLRCPLEYIRQQSGTQTHGISVQGIREGALALHLDSQAYRLEQGAGKKGAAVSLSHVPTPAILHLLRPDGRTHFVVLYRVRTGKKFGRARHQLRIMDPEDGQLQWRTPQWIETQWTGVVITLAPDAGFCKENHIPSFSHRMRVLLRGQYLYLTVALAASLVYTLAGVASALFMQQMMDRVMPMQDTKLLNYLAVAVVYVTVCALVLEALRGMLMLRTGLTCARQLVMGFYRHILYLPQRFFDQRSGGELIARINDAFKISSFLSSGLVNVALCGFTLLVSFALLFGYYWKLALLCVACLPLYALIYKLFDHKNKDTQRAVMVQQAALESQLVDTLRGVTQIKYSTAQEYCIGQTDRIFRQYVQYSGKSGANQLIAGTAGETVSRLMGLSILWVGATLVFGHHLSVGQLLSFYALTAYFTEPVNDIIAFSQKYRDARIASERLFEIMELTPEQNHSAPNSMSVNNSNYGMYSLLLCGNLVIDDLSFHFPGRGVLFSGFSYTFPAGKITAIAGESGSGKSTLAALLMRLYTPDGGRIYLDPAPVLAPNLEQWRHLLGIVPQKADLFEGSILENIAWGIVPQKEDLQLIEKICRELGLDTFINELPQGILTPLGTQGMQLSGGQRQRIALARALFRNPQWLILDEATSSLDSTSEAYVLQALVRWRQKGMGMIVIAHRMSSLAIADRILLLHNGQVYEEGTHDRLWAINGKYAAWCRQQGINGKCALAVGAAHTPDGG